MTTANRIVIDPERCSGHGRCYDVAPGLFTDDDRGYGRVVGDGEIAPEALQEAEVAARMCPEQAIGIVEVSK